MFANVPYRRDGKMEVTTPLKYAFEKYDTYTWKMVRERVKYNPTLMALFVHQLDEQRTHIDLKGYVNSVNTYNSHINFKEISPRHHNKILCPQEMALISDYHAFDRNFENACKNLRKTQCEALPAHMMREFARCYKADTWNVTAEFNTELDTPPLENEIYDYVNNCFVPIYPSDQSKLGDQFMLTSGEASKFLGWGHYCLEEWCELWNYTTAMDDMNIFCHLLEVRKRDLASLRSELGLSPEDENTVSYSP